MSKKIKYISAVFIVILSLLVLPFSVSAATGTVYTMPIAQPTIDTRTGYVEVLANASSGGVHSFVFIYTIVNMNTDNVPADPIVNLSATVNSVSFRAPEDCYLYVTLVYDDGRLTFKNSVSDGNSVSETFSKGILGIHFYGNIRYSSTSSFTSQPAFTIAYSSEAASYNMLNSIYNALNLIRQNTDSLQSIQGIEYNTSEILEHLQYGLPDYSSYLDSIFRNTSSMAENMQTILDQIYPDHLQDYFYNTFSFLCDFDERLMNVVDYLKSISQDTRLLETLQDLEQNSHVQVPSSSTFNPDFDKVSPPRDDGTIQDIEDAEQEALGGLTQEQIKDQVDSTMDFDDNKDSVGGDEIDTNHVQTVNNLFVNVFNVFGGSWSTYFILNLTLAFAAFLIGRRY